MLTSGPIGPRLGAAPLATSALLFAAFPLVRPFFALDVRSPTLAAVASGPLASPAWVISHFLLLAAFALLPLGLLAIYAVLADGPAASPARRGLVLSVAGTGLVSPAVGVETFAMPTLGQLYLDGVDGVAPALAWIYRGPMTLVMLLGLFLLGVGAIDLARAIARSETLPRWGGRALAAGLALWVPLLPRPIRVVDGLAIGLGGAWLAWAIWRRSATGAATAERPPRPSSSESMLTARCTP
jgi:hypothetical protein